MPCSSTPGRSRASTCRLIYGPRPCTSLSSTQVCADASTTGAMPSGDANVTPPSRSSRRAVCVEAARWGNDLPVTTSLVVMAAGRGSRFGGMKQVAGLGPSEESLFDFAVYDAVQAGFDNAIFVVSEESREAVEQHVTGGLGRHVEVRYALQAAGNRPKPWGTG